MHEEQAPNEKIFFKEESYNINGAAVEVHRVLGPGFLEAVYQEAMELELTERDIPFQSQERLEIEYKGKKLSKEFIPDLICYQQIIVELKALDSLGGVEEAQLLNYLKATGFRLGLLVNFGSKGKLEWKLLVK